MFSFIDYMEIIKHLELENSIFILGGVEFVKEFTDGDIPSNVCLGSFTRKTDKILDFSIFYKSESDITCCYSEALSEERAHAIILASSVRTDDKLIF